MTAALKTRPLNLTFEEFLAWDDGTDDRYELEDGELEQMPEPSRQHEDIGEFLSKIFDRESERAGLGFVIRRFISVKVDSRGGKKPDVVVVPKADWFAIDPTRPAALTKTPPMVVEIVSGGNWKTDYTKKKLHYLKIGVPEYVIVDPIPKGSKDFLEVKEPTVSVCLLEGGIYRVTQYRGADVVPLKTFPELTLTAEQILKAGQ
jgi:Uma2 family endonuclease